jgi:hypothetical protein
MKEKIKKYWWLIIIITALITGGIFYKRNIDFCKDNCSYVPAKEAGGIISPDKGNYWRYEERKFESQEQCVDYCLRNK